MGRSSRTLAAVHDASRTPDCGTQLNPLIGDAVRPAETSETMDAHDLLVGIALGLRFDFLLGSAFKLIAEAQAAKGAARVAKIEEAQRYLIQARRQAAAGAP